MPRKKGQGKAKNLGKYAEKRKRAPTPESDSERPQKHARDDTSSTDFAPIPSLDDIFDSDDEELDVHDCGSSRDGSDDGEDSDDDAPIDVEEENDVPHPRTMQDLLDWLAVSKQRLGDLHASAGPKRRRAYHSSKIGKDISVRREQEIWKADRERREREAKEDQKHGVKSTTIADFFSRKKSSTVTPRPAPPPPDDDVIMISSDESDTDVSSVSDADDEAMDPGTREGIDDSGSVDGASQFSAAPSHHSSVTIEDVEEEEIDTIPAVLDFETMAEEGLDEIPWDPSEESLPRLASEPVPVERPASSSIPPSTQSSSETQAPPIPEGFTRADDTFFPHDRGFTMPGRPQKPRRYPSQVPDNEAVKAAIDNLQHTVLFRSIRHFSEFFYDFSTQIFFF
ncbi:hypothetical protein BDZ89DRAFT_1127033 [Hymenopellis radicata]|nr:hypothetical protein BDZ89DRAFT_1127033 [Hymenopellis radicata]